MNEAVVNYLTNVKVARSEGLITDDTEKLLSDNATKVARVDEQIAVQKNMAAWNAIKKYTYMQNPVNHMAIAYEKYRNIEGKIANVDIAGIDKLAADSVGVAVQSSSVSSPEVLTVERMEQMYGKRK